MTVGRLFQFGQNLRRAETAEAIRHKKGLITVDFYARFNDEAQRGHRPLSPISDEPFAKTRTEPAFFSIPSCLTVSI
jgi:hypothetical protein